MSKLGQRLHGAAQQDDRACLRNDIGECLSGIQQQVLALPGLQENATILVAVRECLE